MEKESKSQFSNDMLQEWREVIQNPLITNAWDKWSKNSFLRKWIPNLIACEYLLKHERITEESFAEYRKGMELVPKYFLGKDEALGIQIDTLINPVLNKMRVFWDEDYKKYMVKVNIDEGTGLQELTINGLKIPITRTAIKRHITRNKLDFLTWKDIDQAKYDFLNIQGWQKPTTQQNDRPQCLTRKPEFTDTKLRQLHKSLMDGKYIKQGDLVNNFLYVFGAYKNPESWQRVNWIGANPALATLVNILAGIEPKPSIVNPLFKTKTSYDSQSTTRIDNRPIKDLLKILLRE